MTNTTNNTSKEPMFFEQTWDLVYRHALGDTVSTFFEALRERQLLGRRCATCERVLFPPRGFCDRCHKATGDWVELDTMGTLEMFTIVVEPFRGIAVAPPYVLAYGRPNGADTAAVGFLQGIDLDDIHAAAEQLEVGMPIEIKFIEEPQGRATDIWFQPVSGAPAR